MNIFDILKDINFEKSYKLHLNVEFQKEYNDFMINRYLSMTPETVFEADILNHYYNIPKSAKYLFLCDIIEKQNRFIKYIKSDKESEDAKMVKHICDLYYVNKDHAKDILKTITNEERETIKKYYETKTIKKRD